MHTGKKICCVFNVAPHYRSSIYKLIDTEFSVDFYIGDKIGFQIRLMDYSELKGFKRSLKYIPLFGSAYYQVGSLRLSFMEYRIYLMTGEVNCISTWVILFINLILGKRTYLWTHGFYGDENSLTRIVKSIYFKMASGLFLYGNRAKYIMIDLGFNPDKLHVIYNSLDYNRQILIRKKLRPEKVFNSIFNNNLATVIYTGRVQKIKRLDLLISAIARLNEEGIKLNLLLIGDINNDIGLKELANDLNIEQYIYFYGPCYNEEELGRFIFNSDACVSPGNVGLTAIHALTYGTPVITHDNYAHQMPEYEAITPGITGDFFREGSLLDLCDKIKQWVYLNSIRRNNIRAEAFRTIDDFFNPQKQILVLKTALFTV